MSNITQYIEAGLSSGYNQNLVLKGSEEDFEKKIVEYLLTVNIAQQLIGWNQNENYNYSINLEYDSEEFLNNAFENEIGPGLWDEIRPTTLHGSIRIGKIDIAILIKESNRSYVGIEVKGINQPNAEILADFERLAQALIETDKKLINSIAECYCAFIRNIGGNERVSSGQGLQNTKESILTVIHEVLSSSSYNLKVKFEVKAFQIIKRTGKEVAKFMHLSEFEIDYSEAAKSTGEVFGVIIKITKI